MSLTDYLTKNYLTADPPSKPAKKKHKHKHTATLTIQDDEDDTLFRPRAAQDPSEDAPTIHSSSIPAKRSGWKTVGAPAPAHTDQAAADAIIAGAEIENERRRGGEDEGPQVVGGGSLGADAASVKERARRRDRSGEDAGKTQGETIYRDATGRIINVAMARAEARKQAEAEARKGEEQKEMLRGEVQKREAGERRERLKGAKYLDVGRGVDDADMNEELKGRERWDDPMAGMLGERRERGGGVVGGGGKGSRRNAYQGSFEPNRYGVRPGSRWDGVDRSNGFEREWFAARNKRRNLRELEYAWEMDE